MFRSVSVPVMVRAVPLPPRVMPVPAAAVRLPPVLVVSVTVRLPDAASTSLKSIDERSTLLDTSSVSVISVGNGLALL